jgi:3-oxoadipate enol-lactonase/4-carboxymuconolactone decarboxylase
MPYANSNGANIYWETSGSADAPPLLLLNSLGTTTGMWEDVAAELASDFLVIRTDTRGHGQSQTSDGDYTIDLLAQDALAVLNAAGVEKAAVCGLSLGALVAVHLLKTSPEHVSALVLSNIAMAFNPPDWLQRAQAVRMSGMEAVVDASMPRFLTENFRTAEPARTNNIRDTLASNDPEGYAACCMAIANTPTLPTDLKGMDIPLLSIGGKQDAAAPPELAQQIAALVKGGVYCLLDAGHLSATEQPLGFSQAVRGFLAAR